MESPSGAIEFDLLGPGDYERAKKILDRAKHPGFVRRELFFRCATSGLAVVARLGVDDLGVALVAKNKLHALSVVVKGQGKGVGSALMARSAPKFVSAIMEKVPWFERLGYRAVGAPKVGQNGKQAVQLMELAGEIIPPAPSAKPAEQSTKDGPAEDYLPPLQRTRGVSGVRRLAVGILQQQLERCRNRVLDETDRAFVIEAVKALVTAERNPVTRGSGGGSAGVDPLKVLTG